MTEKQLPCIGGPIHGQTRKYQPGARGVDVPYREGGIHWNPVTAMEPIRMLNYQLVELEDGSQFYLYADLYHPNLFSKAPNEQP